MMTSPFQARPEVLLSAALLFASPLQSVSADTLDVPAEYPTIQAAIDTAVDGDVVLVADGAYIGVGNSEIDFLGKAITVRSASGPHHTRIVGLWPVSQARAFKFQSGESNQSVLDGFTIMNGFGFPGGGAIFISNQSSPSINNCIITDCIGYDYGGAMMIQGGSPIITNCVFAENYSDFYGGAIATVSGGHAQIRNCTFSGNTTGAFGGGIFVAGSASIAVSNCTLVGNDGGGVYHQSSMDASIANCLIAGNQAGAGGGGLRFTNSSPQITNCTIVLNQASSAGGLYASGAGAAVVNNSILWANLATSDLQSPGEINAGDTVVNHTIVEGGWSGPGSNILKGDPLLQDVATGVWTAPASYDGSSNTTIFTDDNANFVPGALKKLLINLDIAQPRLLHVFDNTQTTVSVLGDFTAGQFIDAIMAIKGGESYTVIDARVISGSPAIDAGNNAALAANLVTDLDGGPRYIDDPATDDTGIGTPPIVDLGAYEFAPAAVPGDVNGDGIVNVDDLLAVINDWGLCPNCELIACPADLTEDCFVNVDDLLMVINNWG